MFCPKLIFEMTAAKRVFAIFEHWSHLLLIEMEFHCIYTLKLRLTVDNDQVFEAFRTNFTVFFRETIVPGQIIIVTFF